MTVVDDLFDVRGQVALVTGGASGLGYAFATILAQAGATVVVADWNADALDKAVLSLTDAAAAVKAPPLISGGTLDVSDATAVHAFVDGVVDAHGRIDIVFANAGVARGRPPLLPEGWLDDMSMTDYDALINVNLHGVVYTVQAAAKHMKRQRSGSIVTTASTAGLRNDPYTPYSYAIAKAGVVNFTKQAAHDLARWNVRVNAIAPGPFKTNLGGGAPTSAAAEDMWKAVVPLGRMGNPDEIKGLALLLASNASTFMTGGIYPIDGGALLQGPSLPTPD
ncbi:MAG TPA: SDR family oxidoreductase [Trebonia sp.]|jgi:NAD(P)-dependent dehydrogenase (short-subunit alcohol dehydrogenase family)|nr:SDR family oxidoreductase [Trebonia sp.]